MEPRRRCRECRCLFRPDPRASAHQRTCKKPECQRERHRRACADYRKRQAPELEAKRVQKRLRGLPEPKPPAEGAMGEGSGGGAGPPPAASGEINWLEIRALCGVALTEVLRLLHRELVKDIRSLERQTRAPVLSQSTENKGESSQSPWTQSSYG